MLRYILLRLGQAVLTIFGVMILTFLLFRVVASDIAAANLGPRAKARDKAEWLHKHGYDKPWVVNLHRRLILTDKTSGPKAFKVDEPEGSRAVSALALISPGKTDGEGEEPEAQPRVLTGRFVFWLTDDTPLKRLTDGESLVVEEGPPARAEEGVSPVAAQAGAGTQPSEPVESRPTMLFELSDGSKLTVDLTGVGTCGELIRRINEHPENKGRLEAGITRWRITQVADSQFFHHLINSATFQARSLEDNRKLTRIIAERAPASLAITVPSLAIGWTLAMIISCFVAYYRDTWIDKVGVFLSVLGMCVPFLAFMILGQWAMFKIAPKHAYGTFYRGNVYVPIAVMVIAGLGGSVRFYRTIILDEVNRDYVRTARAKGVPLPTILFKHVLKNCMLPILTNLLVAIPFLIMGSLLVETYFGIPGLGDLMISSINNRNEPILSAMVFLTAAIYTVGVLLTDLSYAVFDPRIRLR